MDTGDLKWSPPTTFDIPYRNTRIDEAFITQRIAWAEGNDEVYYYKNPRAGKMHLLFLMPPETEGKRHTLHRFSVGIADERPLDTLQRTRLGILSQKGKTLIANIAIGRTTYHTETMEGLVNLYQFLIDAADGRVDAYTRETAHRRRLDVEVREYAPRLLAAQLFLKIGQRVALEKRFGDEHLASLYEYTYPYQLKKLIRRYPEVSPFFRNFVD